MVQVSCTGCIGLVACVTRLGLCKTAHMHDCQNLCCDKVRCAAMPQSNWAWPLLKAHAGMHLLGARTWALSFASCLLAPLCLKGVNEPARVCELPCPPAIEL